jgi:prephenate dehydrogenase
VPQIKHTVAIVGTGLIGGSLGLALKHAGFPAQIRGHDHDDRLRLAGERGAIDVAAKSVAEALAGADLAVLATPIGATLDLLPQIARLSHPPKLITDTGSTKVRIIQTAQHSLGAAAEQFIGGHPMAGREVSGIEHADANLFRGTRWILTPLHGRRTSQEHSLLLEIIEAVGARVLVLDGETHDRTVAFLSHLPQFLSTALACELHEEFLGDGEGADDLLEAAGNGVRDMVRLAASPYQLWRDIVLTNTDAIDTALQRCQRTLEHLRMSLCTRDLQQMFEQAHELHLALRAELRGAADSAQFRERQP